MKIYRKPEEYGSGPGAIVTVGMFDGLHLGHRMILDRMHFLAHREGVDAVVVTFDPHPRLVLYPDSKDLRFITTSERKFRILEEAGIRHLLIIPFTRHFAETPAEDFARDILSGLLRTLILVTGYDHHFGRNREGDTLQIRHFAEKYGFSVEEIPAQYVDGEAVSSTKIRNALMAGEVSRANRMLGYEYSISGKVVRGNGIGRSIGFPTANIEMEDPYQLIAADGVYACRVMLGGLMYEGMSNIGTRPTVGRGMRTIEVHLIGFEGGLYDESIEILYVERIRDERKFGNLEQLRQRLLEDRDRVRAILAS